MYTSGRWLNRDELERNSRRIVFDISALRDRAISLCPGATKIVKCEEREGGFNRVFLFTMDTDSCAVARLPTGIAGPPRLTTNSEVATMTYRKAGPHTSLLGCAVDMFNDCCFMYSTIQNLASNTENPRLER
jgi:hypothetical protein